MSRKVTNRFRPCADEVGGPSSIGFREFLREVFSSRPHDFYLQPMADTLQPVAAPRRRGKSLMRRKGQDGSIFQKGRKQNEKWVADKPAYLRFWRDVPGQVNCRRGIVSLGLCRTKREAREKADATIVQLGINSSRSFKEATSTTTFRQQGEWWLKSLATRKRNPLQQTTIDTRRYALDKWIYPILGNHPLAEINNRSLKGLVEQMAVTLAASTIRDYANVVKAIVTSAIDENGEPVYPRKWNDEFIDAPMIGEQNQPSTTSAGMTKILSAAIGQYQVLYALLAGCGPLRVGEALGLEIDKHISPDCRTFCVKQKAKRGEIQRF